MPEEPITQIPEGTEVEKPVIQKGTVGISLKYPAPRKLKMVTDGIVYFCAGLGGITGGTDLFSGYQAKVIAVVLSSVVLGCGAIQRSIGVKPDNE